MSLASVLVISVKVERLSPKTFASADPRLLALFAVGILQEVERRLHAECLAADLELQAGDRLVEKPVPGRAPGRGLLVEELFHPVFQLIGAFLADVGEPGRVVGKLGVRHGAVQHRVLDPVQLQLEEQQVGAGGRQPVLHIAVELLAFGVGGLAGIDEAGKGDQAAEQFLQRLVVLHGLRQFRRVLARQRLQPALVGFLEGARIRGRLIKVRLHGRGVHGRVEIGEVPFRQGAEVVGDGACGGRRERGRGRKGGIGQRHGCSEKDGPGKQLRCRRGACKRLGRS